MADICAQRDLVSRKIGWFLWGAPWAVIAIGAGVGGMTRTFLWTPAFLVMGVSCVVNAARCRRLHCYLTGPLYLLASIATVLGAIGPAPVDSAWIAWGAFMGTVVAYALEWLHGRYVARDEATVPEMRPR